MTKLQKTFLAVLQAAGGRLVLKYRPSTMQTVHSLALAGKPNRVKGLHYRWSGMKICVWLEPAEPYTGDLKDWPAVSLGACLVQDTGAESTAPVAPAPKRNCSKARYFEGARGTIVRVCDDGSADVYRNGIWFGWTNAAGAVQSVGGSDLEDTVYSASQSIRHGNPVERDGF